LVSERRDRTTTSIARRVTKISEALLFRPLDLPKHHGGEIGQLDQPLALGMFIWRC
jgi:hypothetical protein